MAARASAVARQLLCNTCKALEDRPWTDYSRPREVPSMRHTALSTVLLLAFALVATPAQGSTIVNVLNATYSVTVTVGGHPEYPTETTTSTDSRPVSESLSRVYIPADTEFGNYGYADATASAGWLDVLTMGGSWFAESGAFADSEVIFSPLEDGVAVFNIDGNHGIVHNGQSVTLFDVTANTQMWTFSTERWAPSLFETVPTFLSAENIYSIHLTAFIHSSGDGAYSALHASGIQAVPDNVHSFMCLCMGLLVALLGWKLQS